MLPLGTKLPVFALTDARTGQQLSSQALSKTNGVLVMFICNHCPFVVHIRKELVRVANEAVGLGLQVVAINSNSIESHPQDGPIHMKALAESDGFKFPFLFDETQSVAKTFDAACTPDFFLFDAKHVLVYRGQFDDSRPSNNKPVTGADLRAAIRAVVESRPVTVEQKPSVGCNIKWNT
jgi:peroxiredoxin